jgi:hypothetical protein
MDSSKLNQLSIRYTEPVRPGPRRNAQIKARHRQPGKHPAGLLIPRSPQILGER